MRVARGWGKVGVSMRILFIADGRSPIARNWISYFIRQGHEVYLASTFACPELEGLAGWRLAPVAFSSLKGATAGGATTQAKRPGKMAGGAWVGLRTRLRQWLGPLTLPAAARRVHRMIAEIQPELVHAMRIPYEGMLAALAKPDAPLLVSLWGNDFTLHARANPWMAYLTRRTLRSAQALHTDCRRDARLAAAWGYPSTRPRMILPGAGGLQLEVFYPPAEDEAQTQPLVVNPRGVRAYVRTDIFFQAARLVRSRRPETRFACPTMAGEPLALRYVTELSLQDSVDLLPTLSREEMAELFRRAWVTVSPSLHDGTPNTLLEAMACGSFPVAGDIPSLREWITPGWNGLLVDPTDPQELAGAILLALGNGKLRQRAQKDNWQLVSSRAEYEGVMKQAEEFYASLVGKLER